MSSENSKTGRFWYLVYCKSRKEKLALGNLTRQGYEVYLPLMRNRRRRRGRYLIRIEPMFPGYMFIHLNDFTDNWGPIRSTLGVSGLVHFGGQPGQVPGDLVVALQAREDESGVQDIPMPEFNHGDTVRIIEGSMAGYKGIFMAKTSRERVTVLLEMIAGQTASVQLSESHIEMVL